MKKNLVHILSATVFGIICGFLIFEIWHFVLPAFVPSFSFLILIYIPVIGTLGPEMVIKSRAYLIAVILSELIVSFIFFMVMFGMLKLFGLMVFLTIPIWGFYLVCLAMMSTIKVCGYGRDWMNNNLLGEEGVNPE